MSTQPREVELVRPDIWQAFTALAEQEGISLEHPDDWQPFWIIWLHGYGTGTDFERKRHEQD